MTVSEQTLELWRKVLDEFQEKKEAFVVGEGPYLAWDNVGYLVDIDTGSTVYSHMRAAERPSDDLYGFDFLKWLAKQIEFRIVDEIHTKYIHCWHLSLGEQNGGRILDRFDVFGFGELWKAVLQEIQRRLEVRKSAEVSMLVYGLPEEYDRLLFITVGNDLADARMRSYKVMTKEYGRVKGPYGLLFESFLRKNLGDQVQIRVRESILANQFLFRYRLTR